MVTLPPLLLISFLFLFLLLFLFWFLVLFVFLLLFLFLILFLLLFLFLFLFLLLHANGVVVSQLFQAGDIGVMALSVAATIILGAVVLRVETKMAPTTTTVATTNETRHGMPSTLPSDPHPRKGKGEGKGAEGKGGGHHHGRWW